MIRVEEYCLLECANQIKEMVWSMRTLGWLVFHMKDTYVPGQAFRYHQELASPEKGSLSQPERYLRYQNSIRYRQKNMSNTAHHHFLSYLPSFLTTPSLLFVYALF